MLIWLLLPNTISVGRAEFVDIPFFVNLKLMERHDGIQQRMDWLDPNAQIVEFGIYEETVPALQSHKPASEGSQVS